MFFFIFPKGIFLDNATPLVQAHRGEHFMNGKWMKNGAMGHMHLGAIGDCPRSQEASGTSWVPASSPHYMYMPAPAGRYQVEGMGQVQIGYTWSGGPRGSNQAFLDSMAMVDFTRTFADDRKLALRFMTSVDPIFDGETGVPNLFQTGETAFGKPLVDRQHPHNIFSEVAASYSIPLSGPWRGYVYGGPVGEPALGGPMFMHRPSGMEVPEAPITHHWFDSTHISEGVVTIGAQQGGRWNFDASVFNGREPGENRYTIGPQKFDSESGRITFNPTADWSLSASYGFLKSPEADDPGVSVHRATMDAFYNRPLGEDRNLAVGLMYGQNAKLRTHENAYNLEITLSSAKGSLFSRLENVDKDELAGVPSGVYNVTKWVFGGVWNYSSQGGFDYGIGVYAGLYGFPASLTPYYGHGPVTFGVFWRIRPGRM